MAARDPAHDTSRAVMAERLSAQLLSGPPARSVLEVVGRLCAVQAQDPRGARLAVRPRGDGLAAADVDRALTVERSLVVSWLNRGTLHLVRAEDYGWLHALTTPALAAGNARRLAEEGVSAADAARGIAVIERSLAADGPLTRAELRERVAAAGVRAEGQAMVHLLVLAALRGLVVRGPMAGGEQAFALVADWLGRPLAAPEDRDRALAELARRYLAGHGPATERDLAKWSGVGLRDARAGLRAISSALAERDDGLAALAQARDVRRLPPPRLLGAFDPLLMGWASRRAVLGDREADVVSGGVFRPFALMRGRAAGTWSIVRGRVAVAPFEPVGPAEEAALEGEADDVLRFLGLG